MLSSRPQKSDRRIAARAKVLQRAIITLRNGAGYEIPCILKDVSDTGCQIVGTMLDAVGTEFFLKADVFDTPRPCRLMRRSKRVIGAAFRDVAARAPDGRT